MTGRALQQLRRRLGLTQRELAMRAGLHSNTVARMERGECAISKSMEILFRLLEAAARPGEEN